MIRAESRRRSRRTTSVWLAALIVLAAQAAISAVPAAADGPSSAVTVKTSEYDPDATEAPFPDLEVTVSQTKDLIQQGITVSWKGGEQSVVPNQQMGGKNFLQIAQCWGDEPGSNGTRPDRTTCQYGGFNLPGATRWSNRGSSNAFSPEDAAFTEVSTNWFAPTMTAIPFKSATGDTLARIRDGKVVDDQIDLNNNEFFTRYTTNEVSWAGSGADGSGSVSFELQTAQQAPGLGCGAEVKAADGKVTGAPCWLVVIPRGESDMGSYNITESGLFWETWKHHLAVKLDFKPQGLRCSIGAAERQLAGSELASVAVGQWQPKLCGRSGGAVYSLLTGAESDALLAANGKETRPLALTSSALAAEGITDSLAYAPIALTGVSIGFAIDRQARVIGDPVPDEVMARERQAMKSMRITPRLLAKLLTSSYVDALPPGADISHVSGVRNITQDPDFLAINDKEWSYMRIVGAGVGDAMVPLGRSDAARAVWRYIMSDKEAAAFLDGQPDKWGMKVNPHYSTNAEVNPSGSGLTLPRDDFPKADPIEYAGSATNNFTDSINLMSWRPYTSSLESSGYNVLRGDSMALGGWNSSSVPQKYDKAERALVGLQAVIGVTDTSAAAKYEIVQAALRNPAGQFVAPTTQSLTAAAAAMSKHPDQSQVVSFDPGSAAATRAQGAYPLAMPVYAAVNPAMDGADVRADYAAFIKYVVTDGQTPGSDDGNLAAGYTPIPSDWRAQALRAADAIKAGQWPAPKPSSTATKSTSAGTTQSPTAKQSATAPDSAGTSDSSGSRTTPGSTASQGPGRSDPTTQATNPSAQGSAAGPLAGNATPDDPPSPLAAVVPATALAGLAAALAAPALSRGRHRP